MVFVFKLANNIKNFTVKLLGWQLSFVTNTKNEFLLQNNNKTKSKQQITNNQNILRQTLSLFPIVLRV